MGEVRADWSTTISCGQCRRTNPSNLWACLNCGHQIGSGVETDSNYRRPFRRPATSAPFVPERAVGEVEEALRTIQQEDIFSWGAAEEKAGGLTESMIADAENTLRLKLPASLLAILTMQNGGYSYKNRFSDEYVDLPTFHGIAPVHSFHSLQEMPQWIWEIFEKYVDDDFYRQWWDTYGGDIHSDWGHGPRIPEAILVVGDELHWGIGLDYVRCGREGEPAMVHVEMEGADNAEDFLTELAPNFLTFLKSLYHED